MDKKLISSLAWFGTAVVVACTLGPVWRHWSDTVVVGFGGADACLQTGLLEWSAAHWQDPRGWLDLPIFYPLTGSIGYMDSLLGQALLIAPARALFDLTWPAQYNLAFLGSLLLAAVAMASVWLASGGPRWAAGPAALALVGAPYTFTQIPHLNQLPPPLVLFGLASLLAALSRQEKGRSAWVYWWLLAICLILQAAWGWYGFSYLVLGVFVVLIAWITHWARRRSPTLPPLLTALRLGLLPGILAVVGVMVLAQPLLDLKERYPSFERSDREVLLGSADIKHFWHRGVYRSEPADWIGRGVPAATRHLNRDRATLNPGLVALFLAPLGWWRRGFLTSEQRRVGRAFVVMGLAGLVLAFGDSMGLPFTDRRMPLPLDGLREIVPAFKAFRGAWRFAWLAVIAAAWWSAVGVVQLVDIYDKRSSRAWVAPAAMVVMTLLAIPAGVPSLKMDFLRPAAAGAASPGPVLSLPAPENEYAEDLVEASWLLRALELGQPVTGGATGWVPPDIVAFRTRLKECEEGRIDSAEVFRQLRDRGIVVAEIVERPGDDLRVAFWRNELERFGARPLEVAPRSGYRMYALP